MKLVAATGLYHSSQMLRAYCDESYSGDMKTTGVYVMAGFVREPEWWETFEDYWRDSMARLGIEQVGCHASKCQNGSKEFKGMSRQRRNRIQERLILDIVASHLFGVVSIIDMDVFRRFKPRLDAHLNAEALQYNAPHVLAVRQCVQQMCQITGQATQDPIEFVLDRNEEFGGKAERWYNMDRDPNSVTFRHRFGPILHADRRSAIGLQAADMLAFAAYRHATGQDDWQWRWLKEAVKPYIFTTGEEFWGTLADRFEAAAEQAKSSSE